jgi:hypothetical protein
MKKIGLAVVACSALALLMSSSARGWDSERRNRLRAFPAHGEYFLQDNSRSVRQGERKVETAFVQDGIGGQDPASVGVPANLQLLTCKPEFLDPTQPSSFGDLSQCDTTGRTGDSRWPWAEIRKQGDSDHAGEHYSIAKAAALRAGLLETTIFEPFWLRYATKNGYMASPINGVTAVGTPYLVGQSYLPSGGEPGSAHAARSISLLEIAQLPDLSNSLADFAMGNERCPLSGADTMFAGEFNDACHEFRGAMGPVNVTHFKPLNRAMWRHYHKLALERVGQCKALKESLDERFYQEYAYTWFDDKPFSNYYTEAHECVREAMMYEMFGQHFLQDAWSSGHMWSRWGHTSLIQFPSTLRGEDPDEIPAANLAPRQALIAGMVAAATGMVHGAKALVQGALREKQYPSELTESRLIDDPMCGPTYFDDIGQEQPKYIEWSLNGVRHPAGGDLFWWPERPDAPSVYQNDAFNDQRDHMLNCSGKSMLEVFDQAEGLFGTPGVTPFTGAIRDIANVDSDYCFGQLATNASMLAGVGVSNAAYIYDRTNTAIVSLKYVANQIINGLVGGVAFPRYLTEAYADDSPEHALAEDRDKFLARIADRFSMDIGRLRDVYAFNLEKDEFGTESARGLLGQEGEKSNMLGVEAMDEPNPNAEPPVEYLDHLLPPEDLTANPWKKAMSQMLWRGNIKRTCQESTFDNAALLNRLRLACIRGAEGTGDPDSCTECTYRAEALIPWCSFSGTQAPVQPSRCATAGAFENTGAPAGLPEWWFDNNGRYNSKAPGDVSDGSGDLCASSYYVAMAWCSGTSILPSTASEDPEWVTHTDVTSEVPCRYPDGSSHTEWYGTQHKRKGRILWEPRPYDPELYTPPDDQAFVPIYEFLPGPWLPRMVTAQHEAITFAPGADPCNAAQSTLSRGDLEIIANNVSPADSHEQSLAYHDGPTVPRCGLQQRISWWYGANADCASVAQTLNFSPQAMNVHVDATGELMQEYTLKEGVGCYVREPRKFVGGCTPGSRATCNAGWQCVSGGDMPSIHRVENPPALPY